MKMKKKFQKKLIILNRNIRINSYNNYLIYSYLNNYNLKLFFFFLKKKKNYINNLNYWKTLLLKFNNLKILKHSLYNLNKFNINTYKNKFFDNAHFIKKPLEVSSNNLINYNNYAITHTVVNNYLSIDFLKDLILLNFIQTLIKIFEIYKILVILLFVK